MTTHTVRKGLHIRIAGAPEARMETTAEPLLVGVRPSEFLRVKPKVTVQEGDEVATGDLLFFDKRDPDLRFLSPVTGRVTRVVLGVRRAPLLVELSPLPEERFATIPTVGPDEYGAKAAGRIERAELIRRIKGAGLWPLLRQRPLGTIAAAERVPVAIYVNGMDTEPLAADPAVACQGLGSELKAGIALLRHLTDGPLHFCVDGARPRSDEFRALEGMEGLVVHEFRGPHPAGLVGTHISRIAPLGNGEVAWYLKAQEVALLGTWLRSGRYPAMRTVAVAGSAAPLRRYFRVRQGAMLPTLTGGKPVSAEVRVINGTVLSGTVEPPDGYLGFYATTVTLIPEGGETRDLFGWALPQFGKFSASRAVLSWLTPKDEYEFDARLHGGRRAIVNIGAWEKVLALDIHPTYLVRAIQAGDIEEALNLGLLEVTEEDVALCTFVDPCKVEVGAIIRQGLDMYEREA